MSKKSDQQIVRLLEAYRQQAKTAKTDRMNLNKLNFDTYHLKQDFSHKKEGQSREFLGKVNLATEQITSFIQQGLIDIGDWFGVGLKPGVNKEAMIISEESVRLIIKQQLEKLEFHLKVSDALKLGLLGSLMIAKVHGKVCFKPRFDVRNALVDGELAKQIVHIEDKSWELQIDLLRQEDYYPDPTGRGLYEIQRIEMDYHVLLAMAKKKDSLYDLAKVKKLAKSTINSANLDAKNDKRRETGQNTEDANLVRKTVVLDEFWGTIVDDVTGEILHENCMATIANGHELIQAPMPNPLWHQKSPYVVSPVTRVPNSVWHKAVMDAATGHNRGLNELYNLMVDGGMMSVHGIQQFRVDVVEDLDKFSNGISAGDTIEVTSALPIGGKALEMVATSTIPPDAINMFNIMNAEFNQSAFTNDLRLGGTVSTGRRTATEVAEANQSITGVFTGMAKNIEVGFIEKIVEKSWWTIAQNLKDLNAEDMKSLLGEKWKQLSELSNEEIFVQTVNGMKFKVFGISRTLNKIKDFRKLQGLLQIVGSSEVFLEAFAKRFSFNKLLEEIMKSLDIDTDKIAAEEEGDEQLQAQQGAPNEASQIPQAGSEEGRNAQEEGGSPRQNQRVEG